MRKSLMLRGACVMLSKALAHVGRGQRTHEFGDGTYVNPAIEAADTILRKALWQVGAELRKC